MMMLAIYFLLAFGISLALVPLCRFAALRLGYVALPREDRWHKQPTAMFGGVAIALAALSIGLAAPDRSEVWLLLACGAIIFIVGLTDDLLTLKPSTKLVAQIGLASVFAFFGYRLEWVESLTLDTLLTMVWIVGLTNAFNLLDNMDGLCGGVALIAGAGLLAAMLLSPGPTPELVYLVVLLGAVGGFLVYNVHPASIFMGDSGSLFIGMTLAVLALRSAAGEHTASEVLSIVAAPILVLLVPIFDTTLVTISRMLSGRQPTQGGRDHSSHRLVAIGLSERSAVAVLWALAGAAGLAGLAVRHFGGSWGILPAAIFVVAMVIFAVYLAQVRVYDQPDEALIRSGKITPFVVNLLYKRRIAEVVLDFFLISIAYYAAYRLRFEGPQFGLFFPMFLQSLPVVLGIQLVSLFAVGVYRGVWRYYGLMDAVVQAKGVFVGTLTSVAVILYLYRFENYSRAVFVIYAALLMLLMAGSRASFRLISEFARRRRHGRRLVIYGAGDAGSLVVRELLANRLGDYRLLGFIDDDARKIRSRVQGYPVLGGYESLQSLIRGGAVDSVLISARALDVQRLRDLEDLCAEHAVRLSRLHLELKDMVAAS